MSNPVAALRARAERYLERDLWRREAGASRAARVGRHLLQLAVVVAQGVARNQTLLRASALTYFAVLSLIPLLALAIGLVEAFGASKDIVELVVQQIATVSPQAGDWIRERVQGINFRSLGAVGGATLFVTTVLALSSVEKALNQIWGVEKQRPLVRRFPDYLAVLVVAPLLLAVALSLATSLRSDAVVARLLAQPQLAALYHFGLRQAPTLLFWAAFTFLYWFLPNTQVRIGPALGGGALAAVLFALLQWGYVAFQVGAARANALFGSFAAIPILLVWIYFSWAIVLFGAEVAFAQQNLASFRRTREGEDPRPAAREAMGVAIAARVARAFRAGDGGITAEQLADSLDVPVRTVRGVLGELVSAGLVAPRGDAKLDGYQLARAAESIGIDDVLQALRGSLEQASAQVTRDERVRALLADLERGARSALRDRTLADLAGGPGAARSVDPRGAAG
jgi:membrane protein